MLLSIDCKQDMVTGIVIYIISEIYWEFKVLLSWPPDYIFGQNYNLLTTLDFFKAITRTEDWNIFSVKKKKRLR